MFYACLVAFALTIFWVGYLTVSCYEKWRGVPYAEEYDGTYDL